MFSSISNGAFVSSFEEKAHDLVAKGATHQDLSTEWGKRKRKQYGPAVKLKKKMIGWMGISHIYEVPFYYYNYAVGNLIALLFLQKFKKDPVKFREQFTKYLSVGATLGTVETLKVMGIDVEDKKTWEDAFKVVEQRVASRKNKH